MKRFLFVLGLIVVVLGSVFAVGEPEKAERQSLKIVFVPAADASAEMARYEPVIEYLENVLDMDIESVVSSDYSTAILSLKMGDSQIARLTPFSYILATTQMDVEPIVRGVKKSTGKDVYYGLILARKDSGITSIMDLENKAFAFTDPGSTSGYLLPSALFAQENIVPEDFFSEIFFSGSQPGSILAVKNGTVDASAVADNRYEDALREGIIGEDELVIIKTTGMVPTSPICVASDMDPDLKERIIQAWLSIPEEITLSAVGKLTHYVRAAGGDYEFLRDVANVLNLNLSK